MFVNLTNHPSSGWSEEQLKAAWQYGEVVDFGFPDVKPDMTSDDVRLLAEELVKEIMLMGNGERICVHIMGEMTFTFALVSRLKALDITCVASTTERIVKMMPDGKKISEFKFVQFRKY